MLTRRADQDLACSCSSVVRTFRYVATLTAQQIVTSLVGACLLLGEARETAQRQLTAEKAKKGSKVCLPSSKPSPTPTLGALHSLDAPRRAGA